jgi:hypothetical protein
MLYYKKIILVFCLCVLLTFVTSSYSSAALLDDITSSSNVTEMLNKRKIRKWNEDNMRKFKMDDNATLSCSDRSEVRESIFSKINSGLSDKKFYEVNSDCHFSGKLTNNTKDYIAYVVVNIKIFNKSTKTLVVQKKETFEISVMPTVTQEIGASFNNSIFGKASDQLGDNYSWDFEIVGCVPKDMAFGVFFGQAEYNWLD